MKVETEYEGAWAHGDRLFIVETGDWKSEQPLVKRSKCSQCGTCYLFCPTGCIKDVGTRFAIDLDYCKGCGICARLCPVGAIKMEAV